MVAGPAPESVSDWPKVMSCPAVRTLVPAEPSLKSMAVIAVLAMISLVPVAVMSTPAARSSSEVFWNSTFPEAVMSAVKLIPADEFPAFTVRPAIGVL